MLKLYKEEIGEGRSKDKDGLRGSFVSLTMRQTSVVEGKQALSGARPC